MKDTMQLNNNWKKLKGKDWNYKEREKKKEKLEVTGEEWNEGQ
jgi:hypothetical protein